MALRGNIGKIASAIQEGRRAFENIDFGPEIPSSIESVDRGNIANDWQSQVIDFDIFIMGIHTWAHPTYRVTK